MSSTNSCVCRSNEPFLQIQIHANDHQGIIVDFICRHDNSEAQQETALTSKGDEREFKTRGMICEANLCLVIKMKTEMARAYSFDLKQPSINQH